MLYSFKLKLCTKTKDHMFLHGFMSMCWLLLAEEVHLHCFLNIFMELPTMCDSIIKTQSILSGSYWTTVSSLSLTNLEGAHGNEIVIPSMI